jgi:2-haloacid dehalogenase
METMRRLPAHPDAEEAFRILSGADLRIVAPSNGARAATAALLAAAGLDAYVAQVLSVDDVQRSKPRREVYLHAARAAGVGPTALAMVATHPWDLHGAKAAGLITGFVARGQPYPSVMHPPDVTGDTLSDVARALSLARGQDADLA